MEKDLKNKLTRLRGLLHTYGKVAVAFSGGVDSSLLLRVACDTLGQENVTALHAVSCLIPIVDQIKARALVTGSDGIHCSYLAVKIYPLRWREFVANSEQRCYFCKKRIYCAFQRELRQVPFGTSITGTHVSAGVTPVVRDIEPSSACASETGDIKPCSILLDGTNSNDLQRHRPGLQAVRELLVKTPLAEAQLNKKDIRFLARQMKLTNWNQHSNSCLATRIPVYQKITMSLLKRIELAEHFLQEKGFLGCRVKPDYNSIVVHVPHSDLEKMKAFSLRFEMIRLLENLGFTEVHLEIQGREKS